MFRLQSINHIGLKIKSGALYGALFWFLTVFMATLIVCLTFTIIRIEKSRGIVAINREAVQPFKPVVRELLPIATPNAITATKSAPTGIYVASKAGKKYYLPTCSGAKSIKADNKVWFSSKNEALAAGYTPSATCKGL